MTNRDALTAEDVAEMLKISKSSVYKLVKADQIASYYVGRKLRFTADDVEAYISNSRQVKPQGPSTVARAEVRETAQVTNQNNTFVLAGNDIVGDVLSNYLGAMGITVERVYEGSYNALVDVYRGRAHAALSHLYDGATKTYNIEVARRLLPGMPVRIIRLVGRRQGLIVAKGNPKQLRTWDDLLKPGVHLINRERGCGSRILLDEQLAQRGVDSARRAQVEGYDREAKSGLAMASFVARGAADVGIAVERTFRQVEGVDFIPLQDEWLDLVIPLTPRTIKIADSITALTKTKPFRDEIGGIVGYNVSQMGKVVC